MRHVTKVLFTDRCRWQNFHPSLLRLVNNCVESIYKTQKTRKKVLPSATVGEQYFIDKSKKSCKKSRLTSQTAQALEAQGLHSFRVKNFKQTTKRKCGTKFFQKCDQVEIVSSFKTQIVKYVMTSVLHEQNKTNALSFYGTKCK